MISQVILWTNGLVIVFDGQGEQMPELQGEYGEVKDKILQVYTGEWYLGAWGQGILARFHPNRITPLPDLGR